MFSNVRQGCQVMKDHSKMSEMQFWMIPSVKNEVFLTYGCWMDLILHMIEPNVFQQLGLGSQRSERLKKVKKFQIF